MISEVYWLFCSNISIVTDNEVCSFVSKWCCSTCWCLFISSFNFRTQNRSETMLDIWSLEGRVETESLAVREQRLLWIWVSNLILVVICQRNHAYPNLFVIPWEWILKSVEITSTVFMYLMILTSITLQSPYIIIIINHSTKQYTYRSFYKLVYPFISTTVLKAHKPHSTRSNARLKWIPEISPQKWLPKSWQSKSILSSSNSSQTRPLPIEIAHNSRNSINNKRQSSPLDAL